MTEREIREKIAGLEAILDSGATETQRDGHIVKFNHSSIRKRLNELQMQLNELQGKPVEKRMFYGMNLNGRSD